MNLAIFGLVAICTAAPQLFPSFDYWRRSLRWVGSENPLEFGQKVPYAVHDQYSLLPHYLLNLSVPNISGDQVVFLGATGAVLAIIALRHVWHRRETKILALLAGFAAVYALGAFTIIHGILYGLLPLVDKARSPAAAMSIFQLCAAVLAGFGLDTVRNMPAKEQDVALLKYRGWSAASGAD